MPKFRLSKKDREYLQGRGFSLDDIHEIDYALTRTTYTLITKLDERLTISKTEAEERLGHEGWLDGLARSAFYVETTRWDNFGEKVHFYSKIFA